MHSKHNPWLTEEGFFSSEWLACCSLWDRIFLHEAQTVTMEACFNCFMIAPIGEIKAKDTKKIFSENKYIIGKKGEQLAKRLEKQKKRLVFTKRLNLGQTVLGRVIPG